MASIEQCKQWNRDGYLLLKNHLVAEPVRELARWVDELASWPETPGKWMKWYEKTDRGRQLCRVEDFVPYHFGLAALLDSAAMMDTLALLFGEPAVLYKEKINFKLSHGAGFAPHQDAPAFATFGQSYHITVMIAVDPATQENGCLEVVDGLHGSGLFPQAADGTLHADWVAKHTWKPIEMAPGDVLMFDSYLPHRSQANLSDRPRRALYVTYNRASAGSQRAAYFAHKRAAFPPECERQAGVDYSKHAAVYNLGNPIL
jgi:ectoine hydroxylase-related dioxygenase (phytanoyl-CoA dioxygenase family)